MWEIIEVLLLQVDSAMQNTSDQGNVAKFVYISYQFYTDIYQRFIQQTIRPRYAEYKRQFGLW